ncbi:hypothetical protein JTE78_11350 [Pseudomonas syringae pv. aptata]|jgi:hypothetical protein|uniref:Uncharacterized protein n=8 Tax=Pseudomonas TaxID=286 RepID=A0AB37ZGZ8_PSESX|nr:MULTISPECIES: hypothetical protein [Pseudomonas]EGH28073.1 hypothetical protein PSYJA_03289 [Pseudomonas syringae pv. japonica str. M301072]KEZ68373.1 hypothetical protein C5I_0130680 [Pseudomonas syringae pv. syringae FF5]AKF52857.1 hypothetical protein PsyrH_20630 [Pseudomonas syringae pv. syringae HS191]ALE00913.1 hypothetical protein PSYRMG_22055 [Pseudomonas syringae UMAF0158]ALU59388.1 hypothetical protein ACA40_05755 [Pseudomonas syringae pv. lapsa]
MAASKASARSFGQFQQLKKQESIAKPGLVDTPLCVLAALVQFKKISRHWQGEVLAVETQLHRASCF